MSTNNDKGQDQHEDPVCGMLVSSDTEYQHAYADKHYYFCSEHCLRQFQEHPGQYLDKETRPPLETPAGQ